MAVPLSVLIVEDNENDAELVVQELRQHGYEPDFERVESQKAMKSALARRSWQVVISDYSIHQFDGMDALALFKEAQQDIPFICVSGTIGEEIAVNVMRAGAHDYVLKDRLTRLGPAIKRELQAAEERRKGKIAESMGAHLAAIVHDSLDAILSEDLAGTILSWNRAAERIYGYTANEIVGRPVSVIIPPERQSEVSEILKKVSTGERIEDFETVRLCKNGRLVQVSLTVSPIRNSDRKVVGASIIARDIGERKQQESERLKLIEDLQQALSHVKMLSGLLPICAWCKKIRDDGGYWQQVETYIMQHAEVDFTHGICPDCMQKVYPVKTAARPGPSRRPSA